MLILMNTSSNSESGENDNYDYAIVKIEKEEAQTLMRYIKSFQKAKAIEEKLLYSHYKSDEDNVVCEFYPIMVEDDWVDDLPNDLQKAYDNDGYAVLPEDFELPVTPKDAHAPESIHLLIDESTFAWRAFPYNSDLIIETLQVKAEVLAQVL